MFRVVAVTAGLLALACHQAWSAAAANKVFTESWQDTIVKAKLSGTTGFVYREVSGGKFSGSGTIVPSSLTSGTLSPRLLMNGTQFDISLGSLGVGPGSVSSSGCFSCPNGFFFSGTIDSSWKIAGNSKKMTATTSLSTQKCNNQGLGCKPFTYETIGLTVTNKPQLTVTISATTGSDFNGDIFANSIYAETLDEAVASAGTQTINASTNGKNVLTLRIDLGTFTFNPENKSNVSVAGTVKSKPGEINHSSTGKLLSTIALTGFLTP